MLTPRQKETLDFIRTFIDKHGFGPTLDEISRKLEMGSSSAAYQHVKILERKGYLKKLPNQARSIGMIDHGEKVSEIPLLGSIALGAPIQQFDEPSLISVPTLLLSGSGSHYALRASGNSMNKIGILNGDLILVEHTNHVDNGQIGVVVTEDGSATLKKVYKMGNQIELRPDSNDPDQHSMYYNAGEIEVQGKFCGLMRQAG